MGKWHTSKNRIDEIWQNLLIACARAPDTGCALSVQSKRARTRDPAAPFPATGIPGCYWSDWAVCRIKGSGGWKAASQLPHPNDSHASTHGARRKVAAPGIKADLEEKQTRTKSCRFMGKPGTTDWNWKSALEQESERAARG